MSDIFAGICSTDSDRYRYLISVQNKYGVRGITLSELDWMAFYQSKKGNYKAAEFYWDEIDTRTAAVRALNRKSVKDCSFFCSIAYAESRTKDPKSEWEKRAVDECENNKNIDQRLDKIQSERREKKKEDAKMDSFKKAHPF